MTDEMLDPRFESDLRTALHGQAPADVPPSLRAFVAAIPQRERGMRFTHPLATRFAALAVAATLIVVVVGAGLVVVSHNTPSGPIGGATFTPRPSPSPTASASPASIHLQFVIPSGDQPPTAAELQTISDVLFERLAVYAPTATRDDVRVATDGSGEVEVTLDPALLDQVALLDEGLVGRLSEVLAVRGDVEFVPLGSDAAAPNATISPSASPLFAGTAVTSATLQLNQFGQNELEIKTDAAASQVLASWSAANIGSILAITIDGRVFLTPVMLAPITDGDMSVVPGSDLDGERLEALLKSGPLPYGLIRPASTFPTTN